MEICDALKARIIDAGETQARLADAIVDRAVFPNASQSVRLPALQEI